MVPISPSVRETPVSRYILETFPATFRNQPADEGTLIGLPHPYTVQGPDGGFPEMYYWDTYFTNLGLLRSPHQEMARHNVDNLLHLLQRYGYVPNASRQWGIDRSQPPYLAMMVHDVFEAFGDKAWLTGAVALLKKEYAYWTVAHGTESGLSRHVYLYPASPERLLKFYEQISRHRLKLTADTDEQKCEIARRYLAEAETGWDFNPRFGGRCPDFLPVDLNSNLHLYETHLAHFARILGTGEETQWEDAAARRRERMSALLWDPSRQTYADYNTVRGEHSPVVSAAMLHPLMAGAASPAEAAAVVAQLGRIEAPYGIAACEPGERDQLYQWDHPNGWPPSQFAAVTGLLNYGYREKALQLLRAYLNTIERNFQTSGRLWEKYNVVSGNLEVADEYPMPTFLGWTAGVYLWGAQLLNAS